MSNTTKTKKDINEGSKTESMVKVYKKNGKLYGAPHKVEKSCYKQEEKFQGESTYKLHFVKPLTSVDSKHKPLTPYKPNATRSTLLVKFPNEPPKFKRICSTRNESHFDIKDGSNDRTRFRTTNSVTFIDFKGMPVGFDNNGIAATQTIWFHKRQQD
ncbi:hypothetical protein ABK040_016276 [Willaertia magna]